MIRYIIKLVLSVAFLIHTIGEIKKSQFGQDIAINFFTLIVILAIIWYL